MNEEYVLDFLEQRSRSRNKQQGRRRFGNRAYQDQAENGFLCQHCHYHVLAEPLLSGVRNRNHCPYCLWSRCLDLFQAGDRLSACKAPMQPVGLALKSTRKKYGLAAWGELMLVHRCLECGKVSANRIAADDDSLLIFRLYADSMKIEQSIKDRIEAAGVSLLDARHEGIVRAQLFGKTAIESEQNRQEVEVRSS
jgi:DNA-directed RNA polymerase subunit RPC12/RpoP